MLGGDGRWTKKDRLLTLAYTIYEDGRCAACGGPKSECRNPDYEGWFVAHATTCYRKAATEQWNRDHEKQKDWRPDPGQILYATLKDPASPPEERPEVPGWD